MITEITIENGDVKIDVLDGAGQQCRRGTAPYIKDILDEFGLPEGAAVEDCKPEMELAETETITGEGEKID